MLDEGNRPDLLVINKREEKIDVVEMACPSMRNRAKTDERKTMKYTTVREELKERYPGYKVRQTNIVVDILGGFDRGLMDELSKIIGKVAAKRALESNLVACNKTDATYSVVWAQTTIPRWTFRIV